jgi:hypothetical protein
MILVGLDFEFLGKFKKKNFVFFYGKKKGRKYRRRKI